MISHEHGSGEDDKSQWESYRPKQSLAVCCRPNVDRVHAEKAGDEGEREEDDGDDGEDENGFVVRLRFQRDGLRRL